MNITDKYLLEFDSYDPFLLLGFEGLFGCIFSLSSFFFENPFPDIKKIYDKESAYSFFLFILLLFLFYLFGAFRNSFRIMTNKLYSPMELTLSDYFLNPIFIIISYITGDFKTKDGQSTIYFIINLILSIIASFSTLIYNEFMVLFFCGLEYNTYDQIAKRTKEEQIEMKILKISDESQKDVESEEEEDRSTIIYTIYI